MQTNLENIYREHIAPLPAAEQLKLIEKVARELAAKGGEPAKTRSIMELHGLGQKSGKVWTRRNTLTSCAKNGIIVRDETKLARNLVTLVLSLKATDSTAAGNTRRFAQKNRVPEGDKQLAK